MYMFVCSQEKMWKDMLLTLSQDIQDENNTGRKRRKLFNFLKYYFTLFHQLQLNFFLLDLGHVLEDASCHFLRFSLRNVFCFLNQGRRVNISVHYFPGFLRKSFGGRVQSWFCGHHILLLLKQSAFLYNGKECSS